MSIKEYLTFSRCEDICNRVIKKHIDKYKLDCFYFRSKSTNYNKDKLILDDEYYEIVCEQWETGVILRIYRLDNKYDIDVNCGSTVTLCGTPEECAEQYNEYVAECLEYCHFEELLEKLTKAINKKR